MTKESSTLWKVAVPVPLRRSYTYSVPNGLGDAQAGQRVLVRFGPRRVTGYLLEQIFEQPQGFKVKPVDSIFDEPPAFPPELLAFLVEAAAYYMHPTGEVLRSALPPGTDMMERGGTLKLPSITRRLHKVIVPTDASVEASKTELSKAPKRAQILESVIEAKEIALSELKKISAGAAAMVRRLADDGLVVIEQREQPPDPFVGKPIERDQPLVLTDQQQVAVDALQKRIDNGGYEAFLLHGITGSGKTEVYLRAIERARSLGRGAIVLVPEISLTPQLVNRYRARFGDELAVMHSGLTQRDRFEQWRLLREGKVCVAIGVRSAIFAPVQNLGIIVVDEEHDSSFKQETGFRYNARDLAILRAARAGASIILGSATPSLETFHNVSLGKVTKLKLLNRATNQPLPETNIIDLKSHKGGPGGQQLITNPLFKAIGETVELGQQVILFLNRRGFAPALLCTSCGELFKCQSCAVSMTFHRRPPSLICHYCGTQRPIPNRCEKCASEDLKPVGSGTQKAEEILAELFPTARVARLDRDVASGRKVEAILDKLHRKEVDILVGTQMVTKGHDFPLVTLVGVLSADVGLHMPDFRAAERTFQLLTQVAGRAGRSELGGQALIQTYSSDHPAIILSKTHDFETFAKLELQARQELGYPPFGFLAALSLSSIEEVKVESASRNLFITLRENRQKTDAKVTMLGPSPSPLAFVQNRYRWRILLRSNSRSQIRKLLTTIIDKIEAPPSGVRINLDIDPVSML